MTVLGFNFSFFEIVVLSLFLFALVVQLYYYLRYYTGVFRHAKKIMRGDIELRSDRPPVSVIICARDEEENLREFLPFVLEQNYPDFEVIVVNDGSTDGTENFLEYMTTLYPHLRTTFVPQGAKNISTKKLGLTLGIKASKHDYLLFTDADCMPEGAEWIDSLVKNFRNDAEFVLGYGGYLPQKGILNDLIRFDTIFNAMQYLGMAVAGKPYMGVGRNLAYKKETFFNMKGFAADLHLKSGDDDLFVNRGATKNNTQIAVDVAGVTWSKPKKSFRAWLLQKERHLSVSHAYSKKSRFRLGVEPLFRGIYYLTWLILTFFSVINGNWLLLASITSLFVIRYLVQLFILNKTARQLGEKGFYSGILLYDIFVPIINLFILTFGKKNSNIRWK